MLYIKKLFKLVLLIAAHPKVVDFAIEIVKSIKDGKISDVEKHKLLNKLSAILHKYF